MTSTTTVSKGTFTGRASWPSQPLDDSVLVALSKVDKHSDLGKALFGIYIEGEYPLTFQILDSQWHTGTSKDPKTHINLTLHMYGGVPWRIMTKPVKPVEGKPAWGNTGGQAAVDAAKADYAKKLAAYNTKLAEWQTYQVPRALVMAGNQIHCYQDGTYGYFNYY